MSKKVLPPILVIFPVVFYVATFVCYLVFILSYDSFWFKTAYVANAAGVLMALISALPGFIDWSLGIPDDAEVKSIGLKHMLCDTIALLFFVVNLYNNSGQWNTLQPAISNAVFLSAAGFLCTLVAGLLGSNLVHHSRIGIDPLTPEEIEDATHISEQSISH
ncbi:MAG TPA: DUF2231 domain-containing protein [Chitinophagales bacterium]|nr:DUF2231 domain-containing protein [Chitinophagales bacterium]